MGESNTKPFRRSKRRRLAIILTLPMEESSKLELRTFQSARLATPLRHPSVTLHNCIWRRVDESNAYPFRHSGVQIQSPADLVVPSVELLIIYFYCPTRGISKAIKVSNSGTQRGTLPQPACAIVKIRALIKRIKISILLLIMCLQFHKKSFPTPGLQPTQSTAPPKPTR